ncbi:MAG: spore coat associated protein CotJA [Bacillota bacterium]|nr:spore coat associated protein CotJA [Bacillota bacterium]
MNHNCGHQCAECMRIAMTYVPMQRWEKIYDFDKGLKAGTIFPCLHLPFVGGYKK